MNCNIIFQVANDILYDVRSLIGDIRNNENKQPSQRMPLENTLKKALGQLIRYWEHFRPQSSKSESLFYAIWAEVHQIKSAEIRPRIVNFECRL